ncbi:hypothetical protein KVR01_007776 [Diaporthe batatas]|uniref:uncharacterized protein n=1 Tax=Diaporthe batatas TaxID=748121 RepID=UPI001D03E1DC|nr:uncharacterized protein KVR01_007776 [Diaporthe batatas]KAG8162011.1 hypothetical protein KVR01_007776 [Diaporthe batatas]
MYSTATPANRPAANLVPTRASTSDGNAATSGAASAVSSLDSLLSVSSTDPRSDIYNLYVTKICQGNFTDEKNPDSDFVTTGCFSYSDKKNGLGQLLDVTSSIPSSLVVANTVNISVPALAGVQNAISTVISGVGSVSKVILALIIIRIIAGTLALAGSALLFLDIRRFIVFTMLTFATLANVSLLLAAGITTGVIILQAQSISGLAEALSVEVHYGTNFLVLEWVTAAFAIAGSAYWMIVWFVDYRTLSFSRRTRDDSQIGNWKEMWSELKQDFRGDQPKEDVIESREYVSD